MNSKLRLVGTLASVALFLGCPAGETPNGPAPDFSLSATSSVSVTQGESGAVTVSIERSGGHAAPITLEVLNPPAGVTVTASPTQVSATGSSSTLTVSVGSSVPAGTSSVLVKANDGSLDRTTTVSLVVTAAPTTPQDFSIAATAVSVAQGATGTSTVTLTRSGGFSGDVGLTVEGLPSGVTASFNPTSLTGAATSASLSVTASSGATPGSYTATVKGTSGQLTHTASVSITVTAAAAPAGGFSVSAPTTASVTAGQSTTLAITATRTGAFTGTIDLTVSGQPTGVTASFAPISLASGTTGSTLTIATTSSATPATSTLTVTAKSAGQPDKTATIALTVTAALSNSSIVALSQNDWMTSNTCAIRVDQSVVCWGSNAFLVLGSGSTDQPLQAVPLATSQKFTSVAVGYTTACGVTTENKLYCWGQNNLNQFGIATTVPASSSTPMLAAMGMNVTAVALGHRYGCVLDTAGQAHCFGFSGFGQAGLPSGTMSSPRLIPGGAVFVKLVAEANTVCGITAEGRAFCWGHSMHPVFYGTNVATATSSSIITQTPAVQNVFYRQMTLGQGLGCGVGMDGVAVCFGNDLFGKLGHGTRGFTTAEPPRVIAGGATYSKIVAGANTTCGLTTTKRILCWGSDSQGQRGDGGTNDALDAPTPVEVSGGLSFVDVVAGQDYTCGATTGGDVYCWGVNNGGYQLGNGSGGFVNDRSVVPVKVVMP